MNTLDTNTMIGIGVAAFVVILIFVVLAGKKKRKEAPIGIASEKSTVGDPLLAKKEEQPEVVMKTDDGEAQAPVLDASDLIKETTVPLVETVSEDVQPEPIRESVVVEEPSADPFEEALETIKDSAVRMHSKVDPEIEALVVFKPHETVFTPDKLVQIAPLIEQYEMRDEVEVDFYDASDGHWDSSLRGNDHCTEVHMAMLLANRSRVVDELKVSNFITLANQIAIELDADVYVPDSTKILGCCEKLRQVIARYDNSLVLKLVAKESIDPKELNSAVLNNHFVFTQGRYEKTDKPGLEAVYKIVRPEGKDNEVEMRMDIPMSRPSDDHLGKFLRIANDLACKLDAEICDASGRTLTTTSVAMITRELKRIYEEMANRGVAAGSARSLRLFSKN